MERPGSALGALQAVGSRPPSRQVTAPGSARPASRAASRQGTPNLDASLNALAQKLILKLRQKFGDAAADLKGQEIISQEVLSFMKRGTRIKEEDLFFLETRIRARLTGQTPVTNTLAQDKKAQIEGDEWARIFEFEIAEGKEKDRQEFLAMKERQRRMRETLAAQMRERDMARQQEQQEDKEYAAQEQAALRAWEAQEEARRKLQHDIAVRLKLEREAQLVEKNERRQNALAKVRADEEEMAARIAYETRTEFEKEETQRLEAKRALKEYLLQNEANKAIKEEAKKAAWEEDLHYKAAWEAVLDKQERERTDRLNRLKARQDKTAAYAASGALPEYKKWVDPALIEAHWRAHEQKLDREEAQRKERLRTQGLMTARRLEEQMKERDELAQAQRREDDEKGRLVVARAAAEEEREQAKRRAAEAAKHKFRTDLERQMKENVTRRRYQPISDVERSLNRQLLDKVHTWKLTGKVSAGC